MHDVNAAGGVTVGGKKLPVEVVVYDDRSQSEEAVRLTERLINEDKVDFVLPPWGTGLHLAVAPLLNKAGHPHLCVTDHIGELSKRWNNIFWFLPTSSAPAEALVDLLKELRDGGKIGNKVAVVSVVVGTLKFEDNQRKTQWLVGQWQGGEFYGVSPASMAGAKPIEPPKPTW